MRKIGLALIIFFAVVGSSAFATQFVAVLETISNEGSPVTLSEKLFITDELRAAAVTALANYDFTIMTRENILVMLPPDKDMAECEGECLVETGRNISANYVVQGRIGRFGSDLTLTVELYETATGRFIGSTTSKSEFIQGLLLDAQSKAPELFKAILPEEEKAAKIPSDVDDEDIATAPMIHQEDLRANEHFVPRWITWAALGLGVVSGVMGYLSDRDMKYAKEEYDEMGPDYSAESFNEQWKDVEYSRESRNTFYIIGGTLIGLSVVLFVFD